MINPALVALTGKVIVVPAPRNGVQGQSYQVSRTYAEILVRDGAAYWAGKYEIRERGKV